MTWNALPDKLRENESNHLFITRFMHTTETSYIRGFIRMNYCIQSKLPAVNKS